MNLLRHRRVPVTAYFREGEAMLLLKCPSAHQLTTAFVELSRRELNAFGPEEIEVLAAKRAHYEKSKETALEEAGKWSPGSVKKATALMALGFSYGCRCSRSIRIRRLG